MLSSQAIAGPLGSEKMTGTSDMTHTHVESMGNFEKESKPFNGLSQHQESEKSPEEIRAERRFVLKIDLTILPLLSLTLFLASLVRITSACPSRPA
jgi:hypothetical protein